MMDVTGFCERGSQLPVAFLVLAIAGRVHLESPGGYYAQAKGGQEAPHLNPRASRAPTLRRQPWSTTSTVSTVEVRAELEAEDGGWMEKLMPFT